jgi:lipopolysaccharide export system ATP-binding protein
MAILEASGLIKFYGRRKVVDGVSYQVDVGEVVGLLGPNGAGKTTSFRMTTGQVTPNAGQVQFAGGDVTGLAMYQRARLGMGYLAQETSVFRKLTVEQNILAILEALPKHRTLGRRPNRSERYNMCEEVLAKFGLTHLKKNNAARLSGGEKRRLEIARCLVCDPLLILMDEPFTGIDPQTIEDIQQIVRNLRTQGIGILVTDHRVREILSITDRSYLIKAGKVLCHGTPQQLVSDPVAIKEYLGNSFSDALFSGPQIAATPAVEPARTSIRPALHQVVEQEQIRRLVDLLRTSEGPAAAAAILQAGTVSIPILLEALERTDVEVRRLALELLKRLAPEPLDFDPYAPQVQRRAQLLVLRERLERKAG